MVSRRWANISMSRSSIWMSICEGAEFVREDNSARAISVLLSWWRKSLRREEYVGMVDDIVECLRNHQPPNRSILFYFNSNRKFNRKPASWQQQICIVQKNSSKADMQICIPSKGFQDLRIGFGDQYGPYRWRRLYPMEPVSPTPREQSTVLSIKCRRDYEDFNSNILRYNICATCLHLCGECNGRLLSLEDWSYNPRR